MLKRHALGIGLTTLLAACSATAEPSVSMVHSPQPPLTKGDDRVEIEAVFAYDCGPCYRLEPAIKRLAEDLGETVEVFHVPAPLNPAWGAYARAHHVAEQLGIIDKARPVLFDEARAGGLTISSVTGLTRLFEQRFGVDPGATFAAYNSESVDDTMVASYRRLQAYGVVGTPTLVINGRYMITGLADSSAGRVINEVKAVIDSINRAKAVGMN